ncbi:hypothetical protein [Sulfurospirillum halorespirans]|uniref:Uncharacterized protein n=1 Tax=Sulfurospirillum halorespirans DSM 13726 TaxID=1193502 RepID=A0A1D7TMY7_9BACT|nr:hypothetical protein [Sulfurospirillum halorespirans]AOO66356.1 hypothetical protein SHALO_2597 [Sulfurospirillum halorespirans DSM 13726]
MAASSEDGEMNPYISYVDLFSSVILVLLLFVLIMFVNVGYYMQFTSKNAKQDVPQEMTQNMVVPKESPKIIFSSAKINQKDPTVQSSTDVGENTLSKQKDTSSVVEVKESDLLIVFKNNDYFPQQNALSQLVKTMGKIAKAKPNAQFVISVGDTKKLISSTQAKQVSIGRILSLKNKLESMDEFKNKIHVSYKQQSTNNYDFGYLKIDVK